MFSFLNTLKSNTLLKNSAIFFIGSLFAGFGSYLYQLFMGRMLSVEDFGTLATLLSFFAMVSVPAGAIVTVTTQVIASLKAKGRYAAMRFFIFRMAKIFFFIGVGLVVLFLLLTPVMQRFFHLTQPAPYIVMSLGSSFLFLIALGRGMLPGLQRFSALSLNVSVENFLKLFFAIAFVWATFGLFGAVAAGVLASFGGLLLLVWQVRDVMHGEREAVSLRTIPSLLFFVFVWTGALSALSSIDVLFVNRFFSKEETGVYAAMVLVGRVIFFASTSIGSVLFPLSTELFEVGSHKEHRRLMWRALALTLFLTGGGIIIYWFFPSLVITILFGSRYLSFAHLLALFGVIAMFLSFVQLLSTYFLSLRYRWFLVLLLAASLIEAALLYIFHATIQQVLFVLMGILGTLTLILFFGFILVRQHTTENSKIPDLLS